MSAQPAAHPHPGFIQTGWAICLAWLAAGITLGLTGTALSLAGVFDSDAMNGPTAHGYLRGPYPPDNWLAATADVSVVIVVLAVSSAFVQRAIWARTGFLVGPKAVVSTLALTGVAPFLPLDPRIVSGLLALLIATAALCFLAVEQTEEQPPLPLRQIGWCAAAALALCLTNSSLHPLRLGSFNPGFATPTSVSINNAGFADATLLSVSPPANLQGNGTTQAVKGSTIPARGHLWITLKTHGCPPNYLTLRYRLLGGTHTQTISSGGRCSPAPRP